MKEKQNQCQDGSFRDQGKISPANKPESPKRPGHEKQRGYAEAHFAVAEQITPKFQQQKIGWEMTVGEAVLDNFADRIKTYRPGYRFIIPEAMIAYTDEMDRDKSKQGRKKYLVGAKGISGNKSKHKLLTDLIYFNNKQNLP